MVVRHESYPKGGLAAGHKPVVTFKPEDPVKARRRAVRQRLRDVDLDAVTDKLPQIVRDLVDVFGLTEDDTGLTEDDTD